MCNTPIMDTRVDKKIFERIAFRRLLKPLVKINKKLNSASPRRHIKSLKVLNYGVLLKILAKKHKLNLLAMKDNNAIHCPDQYVGVLKINKNGTCWEKFRSWCANLYDYSNAISEEKSKTIVIVLESPHKEEFANVNAIGPAMGNTGCNILGYFSKMAFEQLVNGDLKDLKILGRYKVVLVNAIQYQCSLGEDTKKYRNDVFGEMWKNSVVSQDFKNRLQSHNADVVINACTKKFQVRVRKAIFKANQKIDYVLQSAHPSVWNKDEDRAIKKIDRP